MRKTIVASVISLVLSSATSGDWGKAPLAGAPVEECLDVGTTVTSGYETDYIYFGARFARDSFWTEVSHSFEGWSMPVTFGIWYLNGISSPADYDEFDLNLMVETGVFAGFHTEVGYNHTFFPELPGAGSAGQVSFTLGRDLGIADFSGKAVYLFAGGNVQSGGGFYYEGALERAYPVCDKASFVFQVGVAYSDSYHAPAFQGDSGWNHYFGKVSLPIELNPRTTLIPYLSYTGVPGTWVIDNFGLNSDVLHGGINLSVSF